MNPRYHEGTPVLQTGGFGRSPTPPAEEDSREPRFGPQPSREPAAEEDENRDRHGDAAQEGLGCRQSGSKTRQRTDVSNPGADGRGTGVERPAAVEGGIPISGMCREQRRTAAVRSCPRGWRSGENPTGSATKGHGIASRSSQNTVSYRAS